MLAWLAAHSSSPARATALTLAALACMHAPAPDCDASLAAQAEHALADPALADSLQRVPATLALAEIAWLERRPAAGIAGLEPLLAQVEPDLGARHSLIAQMHLLLAALHAQAGDADTAGRHADLATAALAYLPESHPLRARSDMYRSLP
jgi:hypothetical protein